MHRWLLVLSVFLAGTAFAAAPAAVRKQAEASMLVSGRVTIEVDGGVSDWEVDERDKLPASVVQLVDRAIGQWQFEPVLIDGKPIRGRASMSLLLVANQLGDGRYELSLRSGHFGREALSPEERKQQGVDEYEVTGVEMKPPVYPLRAQQMGAEGVAYLILRLGRNGTVEEVAVEQVNLRTIGSEPQMKIMRETFAKASLSAARDWKFRIPTRGEWADEESWTVRVPVDYRFYGSKVASYGQWEAYIPGPRNPVPWELEGLDFDTAPDALIAGQVHQVGTGLKLLTPLQGS